MPTPKFTKNKRLLQERSNIAFEFPQANNRVLRTFLPFLQNITVTEKGSANLNKYNLVGRAGTLFSYAGAESRRINLTFKINLLHLMQMDLEEDLSRFKRQFNLFFSDRKRAVEAFKLRKDTIQKFTKEAEAAEKSGDTKLAKQRRGEATSSGKSAYEGAVGSSDANISEGMGYDYASRYQSHYQQYEPNARPEANLNTLLSNVTGSLTRLSNLFNEGITPAGVLEALGLSKQADVTKMNDILNWVLVWVNLVRSSVLNNSRDTIYGPPIIRLNHGPMYSNVPCLVEDYNIRIMEELGYEVQTMIPKGLEISMSLIESRSGDFGDYQIGSVEQGDNLTGWESIVENNTIDPLNGVINGRDGQFV
jgi:hypothetical protein